jgi:hypothetical protein
LTVEVVVAGRNEKLRRQGKPFKILRHNQDLCSSINHRKHVEVITREYDKVEIGGGVHQPVKLLERIV